DRDQRVRVTAGAAGYTAWLGRVGEIVAHAAVVPAVCSAGNDRLWLLHVIDWAAGAEARWWR
ncbi:MAG TPA: hypothetical protein VL176_04540, partial [Steroidobacteraceae bacterium]|nr:hypothetical protein [Steroidobacteraceae bacterium]